MQIMRGGQGYVNGLTDLISKAYDVCGPLRVVEVGSFAGESARIMADTGKVVGITCIDPWESGYDDGDAASHENMADVELAFDRRMQPDRRAIKYRGTLLGYVRDVTRFASHVPHCDLVYIDACHKFDAVRHDIIDAALYLKPTVGISGHDYVWADVKRACIDVFRREPDMLFKDYSWMYFTDRIRTWPVRTDSVPDGRLS